MEELLPIRYGRMMVSPFTFYRGAVAIMAYDLGHTPSTGLTLVIDVGQRVVVCQRSMQAAGDMFLGWATGTGKQKTHLYLRQLSDAKIKPVVEIMKPANLKGYAELCRRMPARAIRQY